MFYHKVIKTQTYSYTGSVQKLTLKKGFYGFELWGAQGGTNNSETCYGGYTQGFIELKNETQLLGFNVYNARYYNGFIVSRYFVMYGNEKSPTINYGDFVIEAKNNIVSKIYRI